MKKRRNTSVWVSAITIAVLALVSFSSCEKTNGPNDIGGNTDLELTKVGGHFNSYLDLTNGSYIPGLDNMKDTVVITKNENGIVTMVADVGFDTLFVKALDSALGTSGLPSTLRAQAIDVYVKRFGATLDTTNKARMKLHFQLKLKITSEGIQEFVSSGGDLSRPYTIVKHGSAVGDSYEFTNTEGVKVKRTVTYHSTTDDYGIGFYLIKVMKVEEQKEDLFVEKITYVTNHKFGLVGVIIRTKTGKEIKLGIFPPNM